MEEAVTTAIEEEEFIEAEVHFINTGNSDAILIIQDDKTVLIDAGDNDDESLMVDYLNNLQIKKNRLFSKYTSRCRSLRRNRCSNKQF